MSYEQVEKAVYEWAHEKGIYTHSSPLGQYNGKLLEEVDELHQGILKDDREEVMDAIGDIQVVLKNIATFYGLTNTECFAHAYGVISSRKGRMVDGVFVKDE